MYGYSEKYRSQKEYDEYHTKQVKLKLNIKTDRDILEWIDQKSLDRNTSVQGAIKALIRSDIQAKK